MLELELSLDSLITKLENLKSGNSGMYNEHAAFLCICLEIKKLQEKLRVYDKDFKI